MPMDWVVGRSYGRWVSAPNGITPLCLYDFDTRATETPHVVEDDEAGLFIERIVGTIRVRSADVPSAQWTTWGWRLMPLQGDLEFGGVEFPMDTTTTDMLDPVYANLRWWDERYYTSIPPIDEFTPHYGDTFDHPWWSQLDVHPRQAFGQKKNLWPSLVFSVETADTLEVQHRLRMLIKY